MSGRKTFFKTILILAIALLCLVLIGCLPYDSGVESPYNVDHDSIANVDHRYPDHSETRKNEVVDRATNSMDALLDHLDTDITAETGYYMGADVVINTYDVVPSERSAFRLRLRANLYTYPYEIKDENGDKILDEEGLPLVDPEALARHNELIKYNDIILEWFDAMSNQMLIGFYFDGLNPNAADAGNHLYLNLLGSKRIFLDFGDSVLYQQIVRLITHFDLNTIVSGAADEEDPGYVSLFNQLLKTAITTNYKEVLNGEETSLFFYGVNLDAIRSTITEEVQDFFAPFKDRFDPLTNKYLGFKFSTLGAITFESINSDMQFLINKPSKDLDEMLTGLVLDASGNASVLKANGYESVPYTATFDIDYALRISTDIVIDKTDYQVYNYGSYEFVGDLWIPMLNLEMDALIRTDINEYDPEKGLTNATNRVWAEFYDQSNQNVLIGLYYKDELVYMNIQELMDMYGGGIQLQDLGFPQAYKDGIDLADLLTMLFDIIDEYIVIAVDGILKPSDPDAEDTFGIITEAITDNMVSTMKDPLIPESRNTMKIKLDIELIRIILREVYGTTYTNELIINLLLEFIGVDLYEMAMILGIDVNVLLETIYIDVTYDVDEYTIKIEVRRLEEVGQEEEGDLILRLNLSPTHIGEEVIISYPQLNNYKPLQQIQTYSAVIEGEIIFAKKESVYLSDIFGAMIGDLSGKNTEYLLPNEAAIYFSLTYDMYIRDQILEGNRWTRAGRSAISANIYIYDNFGQRVDLARIYANDVSFDSASPIDEFGYMWIELVCIEGMPKLKVREDLFIESLYQILGGEADDSEGVIVSPTTIIQALMEDSWPVFEPEVIRLTTSNQMFKNLFGVDELIADITLQVGFKQRVRNIDELENGFAMYSVGGLANISGETMYEIKLHETIKVTFDFGTHVEVKDFIIDYDPLSITVPNADGYFYPATNGQFMGVMRAYRVSVNYKDTIVSLQEPHLDKEPINGAFSSSVNAYYDSYETMFREYKTVDQKFYAYYLTKYGYYVMDEEGWGYKVIFDSVNSAYIIDLGSNTKYDEAIRRLSVYDAAMWPLVFPDAKTILGRLMPSNTTTEELDAIDPYAIYDAADFSIFPRTFTDASQNVYTYILDSKMKGYYRVQTSLSSNPYILYDSLKDLYITKTESEAALLIESNVIPSRSSEDPNDITTPIVNPPTIIALETEFTYSNKKIVATWDYLVHYYIVKSIDSTDVSFKLLFNKDIQLFYVGSLEDQTSANSNFGISAVTLTSLDWDSIGKDLWTFEWNQAEHFRGITFKVPTWESITLQGGLFYVEVIIGNGMMATYSQLITMRVMNREVDTDKYINVNRYDVNLPGDDKSYKIKAPVVGSIKIDPYVYIIAKADYNNNVVYAQKEGADVDPMSNFVEWFFYKYQITVKFTELYGNENDSPSLNRAFLWEFEYQDESSTYSELNISNHFNEVVLTYIIMEFEKQVMALELQIQPRKLTHVMFNDETDYNTYTVDALKEETYDIPNNPTLYFQDHNGEIFTLNFGNLLDKEKSSILKDYTLSDQFLERNSIQFQIPPEQDQYYVLREHVINWSNPKVTNVNVVGNSDPFGTGTTNNKTTAFVDIRSYVAPDPNTTTIPGGMFDPGIPLDWFFTEIIEISVNVPDKVISTIKYKSLDVKNISFDSSMDIGVLQLDPYSYKTSYAKLPTKITVYFNKTSGEGTDPSDYEVLWTLANEGSTNYSDYIDIDSNGNLIITPSKGASYRKIEAQIGSGAVKMNIFAYIYVFDGAVTAYELYNGDPSQQDSTKIAGGSDETTFKTTDLNYVYKVDTFQRFLLPNYVKLYFGSVDDYRIYKVYSFINEDMDSDSYFGSEYKDYSGAWNYFTGNYDQYEGAKIVLGINISQSNDKVLLLSSDNTNVTSYIRLNVDVLNRADAQTSPIVDIKLPLFDSENGKYSTKISAKDSNSGLDIELTIEDINFASYTNVYGYFLNLLSKIELTLNKVSDDTENPLVTITDSLHIYTLTEYKEYYYIVRTFDATKIAGSEGLKITIYLGTGPGAQDCTVIIKNCTLERLLVDGICYDRGDENESSVLIAPYDEITSEPVYNDDNPYVFATDLDLKLTFRMNGEDHHADVDAPDVWYLVENISMHGLDGTLPYNELPWDILQWGGSAIFSTLLDDGSRVYRKFEIVGLTVETFSADHDYYKIEAYNDTETSIKGGLVVIETIYSVYDSIFNLTSSHLPSAIYNQDGTLVYVPEWNIELNINELMNSKGLSQYYLLDVKRDEHVLLASALVLGSEIKLYIEIRKSELISIEYTGTGNKGYTSTVVGDVLRVDIHQYKMADYAGLFTMPESLILHFSGGGSYTLVNPQILDAAGVQQIAIPYTYAGHSLNNYNDNSVSTTIRLFDGQERTIGFQFKNLTVNYITIDSVDIKDNNYSVDPYDTSKREIPLKVTVNFANPADAYIYTVSGWVLVDGYPTFELKYDTYRRLLQNRDLGDDKFKFTGLLTAPGLADQILNLNVTVRDCVADSYVFTSSYVDSNGTRHTENKTDYYESQSPTLYYHFDDIFTESVSDIPVKLISATLNGSNKNGVSLENINIIWQINESAIVASGQAGDGRLITGYIGSPEYGQPIQIRIYVTAWSFIDIRREIAPGEYQIMDATKMFVFSLIDDTSTISSFQLVLSKSNPIPNGLGSSPSSSPKTIVFVPQEKDSNVKYRMIWDKTALNLLKASPDSEITGIVSLGGVGELGINKLTIPGNVKYRYDMPTITEIEFKFDDNNYIGRGQSGIAAWILNPLALNFAQEAIAYGIKGDNVDAELGNVTITWPLTFASSDNRGEILDKYLKGGVYRINVWLTLTVGEKVLTREFNVACVFLDMSPNEQTVIKASSSDVLKTISKFEIRTIYDKNTYVGLVNPYRDSYDQQLVRDILNFGIEHLLNINNPSTEKYEIEISNIKWDSAYVDNNGDLKNYTEIKEAIYVYVMACKINGRDYNYCSYYFSVKVTKL
ncbi:MAG: hypothetical protein LBF12_05110 [Christensenellaceae bacterium]|jgi:hypothetical protein|nr:hypothetical protein [Christensenellaceae bacterium]